MDKNTAGGKKGFVLGLRPKEYPLNPQQRKMKKINEVCGIKKGISQSELRGKMIECVGPLMKKYKTAEEIEEHFNVKESSTKNE
ncbi:MAG: hypothetical protein ACOCQD_00065 [archaeon]